MEWTIRSGFSWLLLFYFVFVHSLIIFMIYDWYLSISVFFLFSTGCLRQIYLWRRHSITFLRMKDGPSWQGSDYSVFLMSSVMSSLSLWFSDSYFHRFSRFFSVSHAHIVIFFLCSLPHISRYLNVSFYDYFYSQGHDQ